MKKLILLAVVLLLGLSSVSAQQHLKFMGIPIDGNIEAFTAKLKAKGLTIDPNNKNNKDASRWFNGTFFDYDAWFIVDYARKTKNVYQVMAKICSGEERKTCENVKNQIADVIKSKYIYRYEVSKSMNGDDIDVYYIYDEQSNYIGEIYLGIHKLDWEIGYHLCVAYKDDVNYKKNKEQKNKDI